MKYDEKDIPRIIEEGLKELETYIGSRDFFKRLRDIKESQPTDTTEDQSLTEIAGAWWSVFTGAKKKPEVRNLLDLKGKWGHAYVNLFPWTKDGDDIPKRDLEYDISLGNRLFVGNFTQSYNKHPEKS